MQNLKGKKGFWKQIASVKVFSNIEIFVFILLLVILAVLLFPEKEISSLLKTENGNPDLSLSKTYIKTLLKIEKNPELMILLIKSDIKAGNYEEALKLIEELEKSKKISKKEIAYMKLEIYERMFFAEKNRKRKEALKKELKNLIKYLALSEFSSLNLEKLYKKALSFNFHDIALLISSKKADESKIWLERAYKTAITLKKYDDAFKYLDRLIETSERTRKIKYIKEAFNLSVSIGDYSRGYKYANDLLSFDALSTDDVKKIIDMALFEKDYNTALKFSYRMFEKNRSKFYFKKTVQLALWSGKYELAKHLLENYGEKYITNPNMALFILHTVMALNDRKVAVHIAQKAIDIYGEKK
ncbi:hypothetical protein SAMN06265340_101279 [Desulfurobacterium atlanticum]|uniref:Tetratricopeptide repeat-containing protein n=1 Tax=Desulfurobacterium atlanticum TaxID=240169 RepID=A0A238XV54_9BACT|nr:hypothetical protein SAMN06265340_101279 [Desulfurobacterium atlanticum]